MATVQGQLEAAIHIRAHNFASLRVPEVLQTLELKRIYLLVAMDFICRTARGIWSTSVLPKPRMNPCWGSSI